MELKEDLTGVLDPFIKDPSVINVEDITETNYKYIKRFYKWVYNLNKDS